MKEIYELWESPNGERIFFNEGNDSARALVGKGSKLICTVEAKNSDEARKKKDELLGLK